jgi:hypothetical protein
LKYRYFRLLDTKRFTELGQLLTEDATTSYQSGELSYQGRDAIVAFLEESLGSGDIVTMHNGHHPEIELTGATTATAARRYRNKPSGHRPLGNPWAREPPRSRLTQRTEARGR